MENKKKIIPRGIRNNNPLNIERNKTRWKGLRKEQTDPRFAQFENMEYGIRAAFRTLQTYYTKHGCKTLSQYISRWCPPTEKGNDTKQYINYVAGKTGIRPDQLLPAPRKALLMWCNIVDAMICMECGRRVPMETIKRACCMAFAF